MEEANFPEGVLEAICIAVVAAFRAEREARAGDVGIASGARDVEVATEVGGVGGADRDGGVIGQTGGASSMRRGRSRSPTSRRRSRHGRSKSPSSRRRSRRGRSKSPSSRKRSQSGRSRSRGKNRQPHRRSSPSPSSSSTSSSSSSDDHVFLSPPSRHHHRSPSRERRHKKKRSYVDVMSDVKNLAYRPSFGGRNVKPEKVISFVSIIEDLFTSRYTEKDKIKAAIVLLKDKARVWFDTLKRDCENRGLGRIETWKLFKELFLQQFLPGNFNSSMRQSMYRLRQGSMFVAEFKLKFDEHVA
jgi:hypothetical protein